MVRPLATRLEIGPDFCQLSGEDATIVPYLSQAGTDVYLSLAMLHLGRFQKCIKLGKRGFGYVREINDRLLPLHDALFCETSPGPVKYAAIF